MEMEMENGMGSLNEFPGIQQETRKKERKQ
jgi:hypothetical protein